MSSKSEGAVIGGDRPLTPEFIDVLRRQRSDMPPAGAAEIPVMANGAVSAVPVSLARDALYKHMAWLNGKIAAEIHDPYKFMGNGPYLDEMRRQWQAQADMAVAEADRAREELARLEKLTDAEVVRWSVENGHIARHTNGGLVVI